MQGRQQSSWASWAAGLLGPKSMVGAAPLTLPPPLSFTRPTAEPQGMFCSTHESLL